ncbi:MAG: hypothetical protein JST00_45835 [Deltaproteobacteria bacterium]|nr:hypothetical protein [Deltaproteobacteria bacterium]
MGVRDVSARALVAGGAALFGGLAALTSAPACGGHAVMYVSEPLDGAVAAGDAEAGARRGTASVQSGGEPTDFEHASAILATTTTAVVLMLFLSDRPRTCAEHLAGIDYVGQKDIYFKVMWYPKEIGPGVGRSTPGTWRFTRGLVGEEKEPMPKIEAWFLEHRTCGEPATPWGSPSLPNDNNVLTFTEASASRIKGSFITQIGFSTAGWSGPPGYYFSGSFDAEPCLVPDLESVDPTVAWATLPSKTCR